MRRFTVALDAMLADRLAAAEAAHREVEQAWLAERHAWAAAADSAAQRRERRRQVRAELAAGREAGELLGSREALIAHHLRAELAARGWDKRRWAPLPAGARRSGRVRGTRHEGLWARVTVTLPDALGELLVRSTWHVSAKAVAALEALDADPDIELPSTGALVRAALRGGPIGNVPMRQAVADRVVTTGDVLREAFARAARSIEESA
jgi:hypothetical protein